MNTIPVRKSVILPEFRTMTPQAMLHYYAIKKIRQLLEGIAKAERIKITEKAIIASSYCHDVLPNPATLHVTKQGLILNVENYIPATLSTPWGKMILMNLTVNAGDNATVFWMQVTEALLSSMTAPVTTDSSPRAESHRISFILPQGYTIETAPQPRDKRILLEQEPAKTIAVYRFTWYPTAKRVEEHKAVFRKMIKRGGLCARSPISLARYNPPFILPFLMRNELIVTVEQN